MNILNQITHQQLQDLFGPVATIENVSVEDGYVHFAFPLDAPLDAEMGVTVTLCGIHDGRIECLMAIEELLHQTHIQDVLKSGIRQILKEESQ